MLPTNILHRVSYLQDYNVAGKGKQKTGPKLGKLTLDHRITHAVPALEQLNDTVTSVGEKINAFASYLRTAAVYGVSAVAGALLPGSAVWSLAAGGFVSFSTLAPVARPHNAVMRGVAGLLAGAAIFAAHTSVGQVPGLGFGIGMVASAAALTALSQNPKAVATVDRLGARIHQQVPAQLGAWLGCPQPDSAAPGTHTADTATQDAAGVAQRSFLQRVLGVIAVWAQALYAHVRALWVGRESGPTATKRPTAPRRAARVPTPAPGVAIIRGVL